MKTRNVLLIGSIILIVLGISFMFLYQYRYEIVVSQDKSFQMDRWTGKVWYLSKFNKKEINDPTIKKSHKNAKVRAIEMAKNASTYCMNDNNCSGITDNKTYINLRLRELNGIVRSKGWNAEEVFDNIYLVTYSYNNNGKSKSYALEVNIPIQSVRNIFTDDILKEKYWR